MLADLHDIIVARLQSITALEYIGTALQDEQQARPDALVWLEEDVEISEAPAQLRELTWGIRLSVNHSDTVGAQADEVYALIDAVRTAFSGWQPSTFKGIQSKTMKMPKIKLAAHATGGPTVYNAWLTFRVFPAAFAKI